MATEPAVAFNRRDYPKLLRAMSEILRALRDDDCDEEKALHRSFNSAVDGFQSQKALLLTIEDDGDPPAMSTIESRGLKPEQVRACETGESVRGVSSKVIRAAIRDRHLKLIKNPFFLADAEKTQAFEATQGEHYSAICAPILDPVGRVRAVMYLSNAGHDPSEAYDEQDGEWLEDYTKSLSHVFGLYFDRRQGEEELARLRSVRGEDAPEIIGDSFETLQLRRILHEVYIPASGTRQPDPLLVLGETGTGKDLIAKYIHAYGPRSKKPLVIVNCSEITDELAASRFFGHTKGAFTGADQASLGYFRAANGGVLFLDEIGELTPRGQATLLRAIDDWTVTPVGDTQQHMVDVLVVLATNRDLDSAVRAGGMRKDFFHRFNTDQIQLKALRERPQDVLPLVSHFLRYHENRASKKLLGFTQDAMRALVAYPWPGNVREVKKVCSKLVMHAKANTRIDRETLFRLHPDIAASQQGSGDLGIPQFREATARFQREMILGRLEAHEFKIGETRRSLGLSKTTWRRAIARLGLLDQMAGREDRD